MRAFYFIFIIVLGCKASRNFNLPEDGNCSRQHAISEVERLLRKKKYDLDRYNVSVEEDSLTFTISYELKDESIEGGGAEALVSKANCQAIELKLYQ